MNFTKPPKDKNSGIYKIENLVNGKLYIGSSVDIYSRFKRHRSILRLGKHFNNKLQNAWNKYGESSFSFSVVLTCDSHNLILEEQKLIDDHRSYLNGYNIRVIASSNLGLKQSPETISKRVLQMTGDKNPNYGKKFSEETLLRMSVAKLGNIHSEQSKEKMKLKSGEIHFNKGKVRTEESKLKMRNAKLGKSQTPQHVKDRIDTIKRNRLEKKRLKEMPEFMV